MTIIDAFVQLGQLFFTFFTTGLFTIGGGQAMIGLLEDSLVTNLAWIDLDTFKNFVTVSESTPGPIVINMATFIGQHLFTGNPFDNHVLNIIMPVVGSLTATLAVVLPSFVIILIVAVVMDKFISNRFVKAGLKGIRPFIIGIIIIAASKFFYSSALPGLESYFNNELVGVPEATLLSKMFIGVKSIMSVIDLRAIFIMVVAFILLRFKKTSHPLIVIGASALLGVILYGVLGFL